LSLHDALPISGRRAPFSPVWELAPADAEKIGVWEIVRSAKRRRRRRWLRRNRRVLRRAGGLRAGKPRRADKGSNRQEQGSQANHRCIREARRVHCIFSSERKQQILPPTI